MSNQFEELGIRHRSLCGDADRLARKLAWKPQSHVVSELAEFSILLEFEWGAQLPDKLLREILKQFQDLVVAKIRRIESRRGTRTKLFL